MHTICFRVTSDYISDRPFSAPFCWISFSRHPLSSCLFSWHHQTVSSLVPSVIAVSHFLSNYRFRTHFNCFPYSHFLNVLDAFFQRIMRHFHATRLPTIGRLRRRLWRSVHDVSENLLCFWKYYPNSNKQQHLWLIFYLYRFNPYRDLRS